MTNPTSGIRRNAVRAIAVGALAGIAIGATASSAGAVTAPIALVNGSAGCGTKIVYYATTGQVGTTGCSTASAWDVATPDVANALITVGWQYDIVAQGGGSAGTTTFPAQLSVALPDGSLVACDATASVTGMLNAAELAAVSGATNVSTLTASCTTTDAGGAPVAISATEYIMLTKSRVRVKRTVAPFGYGIGTQTAMFVMSGEVTVA